MKFTIDIHIMDPDKAKKSLGELMQMYKEKLGVDNFGNIINKKRIDDRDKKIDEILK